MNQSNDLLFRALGDPTRRMIFEHLCANPEQSVRSLTEIAGVSQPAVSKHLGQLKKANMVRDRVEGRNTFYTPNYDALTPLVDWTVRMTAFWEGRIDRLEDLLRRMDQ